MMGDAMNRVSTRVVRFWEQWYLSSTFAPVETSIYRVSKKNIITNNVDLSRLETMASYICRFIESWKDNVTNNVDLSRLQSITIRKTPP